jgi:hypothetical protein
MLTIADIKQTRRQAKTTHVKTKIREWVRPRIIPVCLSDYGEGCTLDRVTWSPISDFFKCFVKSNYIFIWNPQYASRTQVCDLETVFRNMRHLLISKNEMFKIKNLLGWRFASVLLKCKIEMDLRRRWEVFFSGQFQIRLKIKRPQREKKEKYCS